MTFKTKHIMTLDVETATLKGGIYDIAFAIHTRQGKIVRTFHAIVREIATNPDYMMGAYYARKMFSHYIEKLYTHEIPLLPWANVVTEVRQAIADYDVKVVAAYNLKFDQRAMRHTHRELGGREAILRAPVTMLDIWEFACRARLSLKKYKELARAQGWVSDKGNIRTTAECAYRFISGNNDFIESHTALEDVLIETEILTNCYKAKGPVPYNIVTGQPWRIVNS